MFPIQARRKSFESGGHTFSAQSAEKFFAVPPHFCGRAPPHFMRYLPRHQRSQIAIAVDVNNNSRSYIVENLK